MVDASDPDLLESIGFITSLKSYDGSEYFNILKLNWEKVHPFLVKSTVSKSDVGKTEPSRIKIDEEIAESVGYLPSCKSKSGSEYLLKLGPHWEWQHICFASKIVWQNKFERIERIEPECINDVLDCEEVRSFGPFVSVPPSDNSGSIYFTKLDEEWRNISREDML
jgi:hypothetical protein